jgi:Myosin head (motor domain)
MFLKALTTRTIEMRGETIVKALDVKAAADSRDAFAKKLYQRLFDWLVAAINRKISAIGSISPCPPACLSVCHRWRISPVCLPASIAHFPCPPASLSFNLYVCPPANRLPMSV